MSESGLGGMITFNGCMLAPGQRELRVNGLPVKLGARAFDLLLALIEHRDRTVGKGELLDLVWPDLVVEDNNLQVQISALRKLLGPQVIATVPGRGYRFTAVVAGADGQSPEAAEFPPLAAASPAQAGTDLALPAKPSVAVLPFDNLGHDPAQACFIDGVIEDIITELSRFRSLFVVARNSSFSYRGQSVDVRTAARQLGVRYLVQGSIRRDGLRIRVSAQLIDARSGGHVWAESYDRALEDVFAVQADLAHAIVTALAPQIESVELGRTRSARPANLAAYELALRARDIGRRADRDLAGETRGMALSLADQAIAIDPECSAAWVARAYLCWRQIWAGNGDPQQAVLEQGLAAARRAIDIDPADHSAHLWKAMLQIYGGQRRTGLADLRRAHELNPNDALTLSLLGQYESAAGLAHAGIDHVREALRLSPCDSLRWSFLNSLAWAQFAAEDPASAIDTALRSIGEAPDFYPPWLCLVLSRVCQGDAAGAGQDFQRLEALAPAAVAARLSGRWIDSDDGSAARKTQLLRRAAGLDASSGWGSRPGVA